MSGATTVSRTSQAFDKCLLTEKKDKMMSVYLVENYSAEVERKKGRENKTFKKYI